jgi:hypothetical protein
LCGLPSVQDGGGSAAGGALWTVAVRIQSIIITMLIIMTITIITIAITIMHYDEDAFVDSTSVSAIVCDF